MDPYSTDYPSPTGAYVVKTVDNEVRMSHWIRSAELFAGETSVIDFGSSWSADEVTWDGDIVRLAMRHYPGDRSASIEISLITRRVVCNGTEMSIAELARWLR